MVEGARRIVVGRGGLKGCRMELAGVRRWQQSRAATGRPDSADASRLL